MSDKIPVASVVLPTKNRAALAARMATATLENTSLDIELIVVDNDDTETTSRECSLLNDPRLRIVRTGGLNMIQNWEKGLQAARGEIVIYIEDKVFLRQGAIRAILELFEDESLNFLTYPIKPLDHENDAQAIPEKSLETVILKCRDIRDIAMRCNLAEYQRLAPRTINTAVRRQFALSAKGCSDSVFTAVAPDYTSGARYISACDTYRHVNEPLACVLRNAPSIGRSSANKGKQAEQFFRELGGSWESFLKYVPLPVPLLNNSLLNDLLSVWRDAPDAPVTSADLDLRDYYLLLGEDIARMEKDLQTLPPEGIAVRKALKQHHFVFSINLLFHALKKLKKGWPNRRLRMRENIPSAILILKSLGLLPKF